MKIRVKVRQSVTAPTSVKTKEPTKKVSAEEFKAAMRSAFEECPRKPTASICGYGGIDGKGRKYDVCLLPTGHTGPHMSVDPAELDTSIPRPRHVTKNIPLPFDDPSLGKSEILTDIIYGWKMLGNPRATPLEADLELFSKGIRLNTSIDNIPAVQALHFLGYMSKEQEPTFPFVVRYKLTKKGLTEADSIQVEVVDDDCTKCGGSCFNNKTATACTHCKGTGKEPIKNNITLPPEKSTVVKRKQLIKPVTPAADAGPVVCERCNGDCVLDNGDVCSLCDGTGETSQTPYGALCDFIINGGKANAKVNSTTTIKTRVRIRQR